MSKPLKPQVMIAIIVAALIVVCLIGYRYQAVSNPGPRTDAAARQVIAGMAAARAAGKGGKMPPTQDHGSGH